MKRSFKLYLCGVLLLLSALALPFNVIAAATMPTQGDSSSSYDYVITGYDVDILVNEDNTFDITEIITAYFNVPKHGIEKVIPLRDHVERADGTHSTNTVKISNITIRGTFEGSSYSTSKANGNFNIRIGNPDRTVTGQQKYIIKYTYDIGKDRAKNNDELYHNIIGAEWDTTIENVTFSIKMPKAFDAGDIGFYHGEKYSVNSDGIEYSIDENIISGRYNGVLRPGESLTVRCELPEGYFINTESDLSRLYFLLPVLFLLIAVFLWFIYGRDDKVVETVEFYPPNGFNSLDVGFLYKGRADSSDVISLLIYLANKEYIKISELEEGSLSSKSKGFKVTKLREYDGTDVNERLFMNGLFSKSRKLTYSYGKSYETYTAGTDEVTSGELENSFYTTVDKILSNIDNKENKRKIFRKFASFGTMLIILMIIATFCIITIPPFLEYGDAEILPIALLFPSTGFTIMLAALFSERQTIYVNGNAKTSSAFIKIFGVVFGIFFGGSIWAFLVLPTLREYPPYLIYYLIGLGCVAGMIACIKYMPKRTPYGTEMLGKIKGFRNFLETSEKSRLESMVMQDPDYFYDILPYAYVLGVSDKWISKFESISLQQPSWYDSGSTFTTSSFGAFMGSTMASAKSKMLSIPYSSSSGGSYGGFSGGGHSSGGGFSGGGHGGGGGHSW